MPLEVFVIVTHSTQPVITLLTEEILHLLIGSLSQYLQGFLHPRWCRISSINSINCPFLSEILNQFDL